MSCFSSPGFFNAHLRFFLFERVPFPWIEARSERIVYVPPLWFGLQWLRPLPASFTPPPPSPRIRFLRDHVVSALEPCGMRNTHCAVLLFLIAPPRAPCPRSCEIYRGIPRKRQTESIAVSTSRGVSNNG